MTLSGRLLVATPRLLDPNFARTVVLLLDHNDDGAFGVVLNRPLPVEVDAVLPGWQDVVSRPDGLFQGGPVGLDGAIGVAIPAPGQFGRPVVDGTFNGVPPRRPDDGRDGDARHGHERDEGGRRGTDLAAADDELAVRGAAGGDEVADPDRSLPAQSDRMGADLAGSEGPGSEGTGESASRPGLAARPDGSAAGDGAATSGETSGGTAFGDTASGGCATADTATGGTATADTATGGTATGDAATGDAATGDFATGDAADDGGLAALADDLADLDELDDPEDEPVVDRLTGVYGLVDLDADPSTVVGRFSGLRIFAGHSGWGGGQLEEEIAEGAWFVVPSQPSDVFTDEPETLWSRVLRRQGGDLAMLAHYPPDVQLN